MRPCVVYWPYVVVRTVDVRVSDDLHVVRCEMRVLHDYGGYILEYVSSEHGLDDEEVVAAMEGLDYAEVVYVTIPVEVEVGDDVGVVVEEGLELLYGRGLGESGCYGLEIKLERDIVVVGDDLCRGCRMGPRNRHCRRAVGRRRRVVRRYGHYPGWIAAGADQCE